MARRYDPDRRQRIIDAALRVVARAGIAGLSHRTVAAEADVPLGSTTYHFASLDDLLVAALRQAGESFGDAVRDTAALAAPGSDLPAELARLMGRWLAGERIRVELEYELYLAALRRPVLRPVAAEWTDGVTESLARRTDPATARALVALMDGICLQALLTDAAYDEEYAREMLGRLLRGTTSTSPVGVPDRAPEPPPPQPSRDGGGARRGTREPTPRPTPETGSPRPAPAG